MVSWFSARLARAAQSNTSSWKPAQGEADPDGELVLRERSRFVRAQHVDSRQLLDGCQSAHDCLLGREESRAHCDCDGEHRRHRNGNRGNSQNEREQERGKNGVFTEKCDHDDEGQRKTAKTIR